MEYFSIKLLSAEVKHSAIRETDPECKEAETERMVYYRNSLYSTLSHFYAFNMEGYSPNNNYSVLKCIK